MERYSDTYEFLPVTVSVVESVNTGKTADMAFKSIGSLATDVLETAKRVAAARTSAAQIQGDGLVEPSGNTSPSRLSSGEKSSAASFGELEKAAGVVETPAKVTGGGRQTSGGTAMQGKSTMILRVVTGRDRCTAPTAAKDVPQRPAVHLSLVVSAHAVSPTSSA